MTVAKETMPVLSVVQVFQMLAGRVAPLCVVQCLTAFVAVLEAV